MGAHRILVLEDDTFTRSLLVTALGNMGLETYVRQPTLRLP